MIKALGSIAEASAWSDFDSDLVKLKGAVRQVLAARHGVTVAGTLPRVNAADGE
jgi:hypothetical protein